MTTADRRSVLFTAAATALCPSFASAEVGASPPDLSDVAPELREPLLRSGWMGGGPITLSSLAVRRKAAPNPLPPPAPTFAERHIPGPKGAPDVRVLVVKPSGFDGPRPAYLFIHGGGYVTGRADQGVRQLQELARDYGIVGVSVDYRLAPETAYPGSLEDNYAALRWLHGHADELGVDPARIAIGGVSAGGGHAAALAIAARDRGETPVRFQVLIYPMLDDRTASTRPASPRAGRFVWTPEGNRLGWRALLGHAPGVGHPPPTAVPARLSDFRGLPPAWIGVGNLDLFCDESISYARHLIAAGVHTSLLVEPGAYHGFDAIAPSSAAARLFTGEWRRALSTALGVQA